MLGSVRTRIFAEPKSQSLSWCVRVSTRRFWGLMSRWHTPPLWMLASARAIWYVYSFTSTSGIRCADLLYILDSLYTVSGTNSRTKFR